MVSVVKRFMISLACCAHASSAMSQSSQDVKTYSESAYKAAETLGERLAKNLKAEKTKVVFLNLASCASPRGYSDSSWCRTFEGALNSRLIGSGIRFLPESKKDEIRGKITEEQVYQHDSMQVDAQKAVELGKQQAFQAFISVHVQSEPERLSNISAESVNIREGVVTISETLQITFETNVSTTWERRLKDWGIMAAGVVILAVGTKMALEETSKGGDAYDKYKAADNADDATKYRKQVEKHDSNSNMFAGGAALGLGLVVWRAIKPVEPDDQVWRTSFDVKTAQIGPSGPDANLSLQASVMNERFTPSLALELHW